MYRYKMKESVSQTLSSVKSPPNELLELLEDRSFQNPAIPRQADNSSPAGLHSPVPAWQYAFQDLKRTSPNETNGCAMPNHHA